MKVQHVSTSGTVGSINVSDAVFAAPVNKQVLAQAVRVYLSNQRQGTSKVQTRSEVTRTKSKWYRQKGTGNARHGARNAPIFVGGGVAHGPNGEQNWNRTLPAQMRTIALTSAFTLQAKHVFVVDSLAQLKGKTKEAQAAVAAVAQPNQKVLVVLPETQGEAARALYNLGQVRVVSARYMTALEVMAADVILLHPDTVAVLEERASAPTVQKTQTPKATKAAADKKRTEKKATSSPEKKAASVKKTATQKAPVKKAVKKSPAKKTKSTSESKK